MPSNRLQQTGGVKRVAHCALLRDSRRNLFSLIPVGVCALTLITAYKDWSSPLIALYGRVSFFSTNASGEWKRPTSSAYSIWFFREAFNPINGAAILPATIFIQIMLLFFVCRKLFFFSALNIVFTTYTSMPRVPSLILYVMPTRIGGLSSTLVVPFLIDFLGCPSFTGNMTVIQKEGIWMPIRGRN